MDEVLMILLAAIGSDFLAGFLKDSEDVWKIIKAGVEYLLGQIEALKNSNQKYANLVDTLNHNNDSLREEKAKLGELYAFQTEKADKLEIEFESLQKHYGRQAEAIKSLVETRDFYSRKLNTVSDIYYNKLSEEIQDFLDGNKRDEEITKLLVENLGFDVLNPLADHLKNNRKISAIRLIRESCTKIGPLSPGLACAKNFVELYDQAFISE